MWKTDTGFQCDNCFSFCGEPEKAYCPELEKGVNGKTYCLECAVILLQVYVIELQHSLSAVRGLYHNEKQRGEVKSNLLCDRNVSIKKLEVEQDKLKVECRMRKEAHISSVRQNMEKADFYKKMWEQVEREKVMANALLQELEWVGSWATGLPNICQVCHWTKIKDHAPSCRLNNYFKRGKVKGEIFNGR